MKTTNDQSIAKLQALGKYNQDVVIKYGPGTVIAEHIFNCLEMFLPFKLAIL